MNLEQCIDAQVVVEALRQGPARTLAEIEARTRENLPIERVVLAILALGEEHVTRDDRGYRLTARGLRYPRNAIDRESFMKDLAHTIENIDFRDTKTFDGKTL